MDEEVEAPADELEAAIEDEILGDGAVGKEIRASEFVQRTGCGG